MGDYATWEHVIDRYPKADARADSDEMQDSYINGVEALMNSFLAKQFTTPVTGSPPLLESICVDLVYCKLAFNRDKGVPKLEEKTLNLLKEICEGNLLLTDSNGEQIASVGLAVWSEYQDYQRSFSELGPLCDRVDPDLLEDLSSDRS